MRSSRGGLAFVLALLALGAYWWFSPETFEPLLKTGLIYNAGTAEQPRPLFVPAALLLIVPFILRFGLPLIFKAALFLPYVAAALSLGAGRSRATFDPARDLPGDGLPHGSPEDVAVDRAIAAALAARSGRAATRPQQSLES
jgi:hypothetical protein